MERYITERVKYKWKESRRRRRTENKISRRREGKEEGEMIKYGTGKRERNG